MPRDFSRRQMFTCSSQNLLAWRDEYLMSDDFLAMTLFFCRLAGVEMSFGTTRPAYLRNKIETDLKTEGVM